MKCEHLGYDLSKQELDAVYQGFLEIADRKKGVTDQEIGALIRTLKMGEAVQAGARLSDAAVASD